MFIQELFTETGETAELGCWKRKLTAMSIRTFTIRLHATGCSLRVTQEIRQLFGVERSHQAIFQWVHRVSDSAGNPPEAQPKRVAVDETAIKINGEWSWLYAAIDLDTKLLFDVQLFGRHGTNPAAAILHGPPEKHDLSETTFPVD